jgi:osmotically-inducible protein OsmY
VKHQVPGSPGAASYIMRPDHEIRDEVQEEIDWDPQIGTCDIAIAVREGVVTLAGFVHGFGDRAQAEADAKRVEGVIGIANDIEVRLPLIGRKPDPEIARAIAASLLSEMPAAAGQMRVRVADGRVTLEGDVQSSYERHRAENVARRAAGVRSVRNDLTVRLPIVPLEIKRKIEAAFHLDAEIEADGITVETADNGTVVLTGAVHSMSEREQAERAAWSVPGVRRVDNRLDVLA